MLLLSGRLRFKLKRKGFVDAARKDPKMKKS
jgi:hypothetical protein